MTKNEGQSVTFSVPETSRTSECYLGSLKLRVPEYLKLCDVFSSIDNVSDLLKRQCFLPDVVA